MFFKKKKWLDYHKPYFMVCINGMAARIDNNLCITDSMCVMSSLLKQIAKNDDKVVVFCRPLQYIAKVAKSARIKKICLFYDDKSSTGLSSVLIPTKRLKSMPDMLITLMKQSYDGFVLTNKARNCVVKYIDNIQYLVVFLTKDDAEAYRDAYNKCNENDTYEVQNLCWDYLGDILSIDSGLLILDKYSNVLYQENPYHVTAILSTLPSYPQFELEERYFVGKCDDIMLGYCENGEYGLYLAETEEDMQNLLHEQSNTTYKPASIHLHSFAEAIKNMNVSKITLLAYGDTYDLPVDELLYRQYGDMLGDLIHNGEQLAILQYEEDGEAMIGSAENGMLIAFCVQPSHMNSASYDVEGKQAHLHYITPSELEVIIKDYSGLLIFDECSTLLYHQSKRHVLWILENCH